MKNCVRAIHTATSLTLQIRSTSAADRTGLVPFGGIWGTWGYFHATTHCNGVRLYALSTLSACQVMTMDVPITTEAIHHMPHQPFPLSSS